MALKAGMGDSFTPSQVNRVARNANDGRVGMRRMARSIRVGWPAAPFTSSLVRSVPMQENIIVLSFAEESKAYQALRC